MQCYEATYIIFCVTWNNLCHKWLAECSFSCKHHIAHLTSILLLQLAYCVSMLLLTNACKSHNTSTLINWHLYEIFWEKQSVEKAKLMLYKPLFIIYVRVKAFLKVILWYKMKRLSYKSGHGTCIPNFYKH